MIILFNRLANWLFPFRNYLLVLSILAASFIGYLLVFTAIPIQEKYLLPCLILLLWGLLFFVLTHSFHGDHQVKSSLSWFGRIKQKLSIFLMGIYSVFFIVVVIATLYFCLKVISL